MHTHIMRAQVLYIDCFNTCHKQTCTHTSAVLLFSTQISVKEPDSYHNTDEERPPLQVSGPVPGSQPGQVEQAAQGCAQVSLELLQGWGRQAPLFTTNGKIHPQNDAQSIPRTCLFNSHEILANPGFITVNLFCELSQIKDSTKLP